MAEPLDITTEEGARKYMDAAAIVNNEFIKKWESLPDHEAATFTKRVSVSAWDNLSTIMNATHRAVFAAGRTGDDILFGEAQRAYGQSLPRQVVDSFATHWESEDAKQFALHNTWAGERLLRGMYAALNASGAGVRAGMAMTGQGEMPQAEDYIKAFNSEQAGEFAKDYGWIALDIPASMVTEPWIGTLGLMSRGKRAMELGHIRRAVSQLPVKADFNTTLAWLESNFEGGIATDKLIDSIRLAPRDEKLVAMLDFVGMRKEGFIARMEERARDEFPDLAEKLMLPWFRPRGYTFSPRQNTIRQEYQLMTERAVQEMDEAFAANPVLANFEKTASDTERMQYLALMSDQKNMKRMTDGILSGRIRSTPLVIGAVNETIAIRNANALFMNDVWNKTWYKEMREERFTRELKLYVRGLESQGIKLPKSVTDLRAADVQVVLGPRGGATDVIHRGTGQPIAVSEKLRRRLATLLANKPRILQYPYRRVFIQGLNAPTGPIKAPIVRLRKELNRGKSATPTVSYLRALKKASDKDPDAVRAATRKMLDELLQFKGKELADGAKVRYLRQLSDFKQAILKTDSVAFGTQARKEEVLRRADDTKAFLEEVFRVNGDEAIEPGIKMLRASLWMEGVDKTNKLWKDSVLMSPGMIVQYVGQNSPDNVGKAAMFDGVGQFIEDLPTHRLDGSGTRINAVVSRAPRGGPTGGFEFLERAKTADNSASKAWKWWSDSVDRINSVPERLGKEMGWRYNYKNKWGEAVAQGMDAVTADRVAAEFADTRQDAIQFYVRPASVALSWAERFNPFQIFAWRNAEAMGNLAMERPAMSHGMYEFYDRISEGSIAPGGVIKIPGIGLETRISSIVPFIRIQDSLKKVGGVEASSDVNAMAEQALGTAGGVAGALSSGGFHFTQTMAQAPLKIAEIPFVMLKKAATETPEGEELAAYGAAKQQYSDNMRRLESILEPVNRFTKLFAGRRMSDFIDPYSQERERLIRYKADYLDSVMAQDGRSVSIEESGGDVADRTRQQAAAKIFFPLASEVSQSNGEKVVRGAMKLYSTLETPDARAAFIERMPKDRDGASILDGLVRNPKSIPAGRPDSEYLSGIEDALSDPVKAVEKYNLGTEREKQGAARQFLDFFMGLFASEAGAAEIPTNEQQKARKAISLAPDLEKNVRAAATIERPTLPPWFRETRATGGLESAPENFGPQLLQTSYGKIFDFHAGVDRSVLSERQKSVVEQRNGEMNTTLRKWLGGLHNISNNPNVTAADFERWKSGEIPFSADGNRWEKLNVNLFMAPGKNGGPIIADILESAKTRGVSILDGDGKPVPQTTVLIDEKTFPMPDEAVAFLRLNQIPQSARITIENREKKQKQMERMGWHPIIEQMQMVGRNPDAYNVDAKWDELNGIIMSGKPGGPPTDLIRRMLTSGERGDLDTLASFAVAKESEKALRLAPLMKDINGHWSPDAIGFLAASGFGDEVRTLAATTRDKYLTAAVEHAGLSVDMSEVVQDSLENFAALDNGIDITPEMRANSGTYLSMRGMKVNAPTIAAEDRADGQPPGAGPLPLLAPAEGRRGIEPMAAVQAVGSLAALIPARKMPMALVESRNMTVGPYQFRGVQDFREFTFRETQAKNLAFKQTYAAEIARREGRDVADVFSEINSGPLHPDVPQTNFMQEALRNLPGLPVSFYAGAVSDIFRTGYQLGVVDYDTARTLDRGVTQVRTQEQLQGLATAALSLTSNAMAGMTFAERVSSLRATGAAQLKEAASLRSASSVGKLDVFSASSTTAAGDIRAAQLAQKGQSAVNYANYATTASIAGQALSFGAGVAQAQGEEDLARGLGTAGGAAQGFAYGASFGPVGAVVGTLVGGAVGYFTSSMGKEDNRRSEYSASRDAYYAAAAENQRRQAAEAEGRSVSSRSRTLAYQQGESLRRNPQTAQTMIQRFVRRPQFGSSQGLVQATERSAGRQFIPRY